MIGNDSPDEASTLAKGQRFDQRRIACRPDSATHEKLDNVTAVTSKSTSAVVGPEPERRSSKAVCTQAQDAPMQTPAPDRAALHVARADR